MEFPRAAPSGIPQTSLGFRGHLITNFPHIMVLLIIIYKISNFERNAKKILALDTFHYKYICDIEKIVT